MMGETTATEFRTTELSMAAFLTVKGFKHDRLELLDRKTAVWVFLCNGEVSEAADQFEDGMAAVEPQGYTEVLGRVRRELYTFLDGHQVR